MPRRLDEARVLAAVAADDPPASADHRDDDEWHAAQDKWLVKWSGSVLPDGPQRRRKWDDRVKEHARLVAAAARAVALPASMPRRKGARKAPVPTPQELMLAGPEEPMQLAADMPERASPARPPEDREDLGLPPLAAVSIEPRQHACSAPAAASMFSLPSPSPPPQPPEQRTATERAAAERAAKRVRRAERERQTCAEGERALWLDEAARSSLAWRRISDPSSDDDLPSVLRAHPGDDSSDVYERWCDYGPELMRGRPYRPPAPQMPPKPPEPQPQEPPEHSAGAFEERRDLPASLQWKLALSDIMIEELRYRHSEAHGMAARGEIQLELQQLLLERVGLDNRMANEKYYY